MSARPGLYAGQPAMAVPTVIVNDSAQAGQLDAGSVAKLLTSRCHQEQVAPILQPTPQAERPPVSGGPRYVFGFKPFVGYGL